MEPAGERHARGRGAEVPKEQAPQMPRAHPERERQLPDRALVEKPLIDQS